MLRNERWLEAVNEPLQRSEMIGIGVSGAGERHSDAMQRERPLATYRLEHGQTRSARDHVIFCVNLKPEARRRRSERFSEMLGLEADTGGGIHDTYRLIGVSEPLPLGVLIDAQEPLLTYFQALPW